MEKKSDLVLTKSDLVPTKSYLVSTASRPGVYFLWGGMASWLEVGPSCPYDRMISSLRAGDLLVLGLFSGSRLQWGDSASTWFRANGFGHHDWICCMWLNFGGNVGLHGKPQHVIRRVL